MNALNKLKELGYEVRLEGDGLSLVWKAPGRPDPSRIRPLLEEVRARKAEAVRCLSEEQSLLTPDEWRRILLGTNDPILLDKFNREREAVFRRANRNLRATLGGDKI